MSVLIHDMEMPKEGCHHTICIYADGRVSTGGREYTAIPVPPHGDLIDRDEIPYKKIMLDDDDEFYYGVTQPYIDRMPTIIPAEEGE